MSISSSLAVSMMIGTWLRLRSRRHTSIPSILRQHHVEDDEVEALLGEAVERLAAVERRDDLVALLAKRVGEQGLNRLLVVDEQDPSGLLRALPARARGASAHARKRNRGPPPPPVGSMQMAPHPPPG